MLKFCLERVFLLLCSVHIFLQFLFGLQCAGVLFAVCNSFACTVHIFIQFHFCLQCGGDVFFNVYFMGQP